MLDFDVAGGTVTVQQVLNNWEDIIGNSSTINTGFIVLEHDLYQQVCVSRSALLKHSLNDFPVSHRLSILPQAILSLMHWHTTLRSPSNPSLLA
jgi:hypothetical protein